MSVPIPIELEAKLLVTRAGDLRVIARLTAIGKYRLRPRPSTRLHSIYLDTPERTLARHKVALRVRRDTGRWEATAKWAGHAEGDIHARPELTVSLRRAPRMPFELPAGPLRTRLAPLVAQRPLLPLLITEISRRRRDVFAMPRRDRLPLAELALDRVRLRAPGQRRAVATYSEIEIERRRGHRRTIAQLAQLLRSRFALTPSTESKFARGLRLLYGPQRRIKRRSS